MANSMDGTLTIYTSVDTKGLNKGIQGINKQMGALKGTFAKFFGAFGFIALGQQAVSAASDLAEYRNVALNTFKDLTPKLDEFLDKSIETYGMSRLTATQVASGYQAMGNSIGLAKDEAADMSIQLTGLVGDFASFYNLSQERARTALAAVYTGETETMKQYGVMMQEVNLQQYENEHGLGRSIKTMSAAEKTMLRYNYVMDSLSDAQGDFARTSKQWANQVRVLKEYWKEFMIVVGTGIKTVLTPVINVLNRMIQSVIAFSNVVGNALSKILGIKWEKQVYKGVSDSAGAMSDLADNTEDAGKAAKKALAPFDDLNVLENNDSGSGDSVDVSASAGDLVESQGYIEDINEAVDSIYDSFYKLGSYIGSEFTNALNNIPWDSIYERARNFGTGLAQFLNGLISPELFGAVGRTIASALNTVIYGALAFATEFDWANLGVSLAAGVNEFFSTFDFKACAQAINKWVQGLFTTLVEFIKGVDWLKVYDGITDFLSELDLKTITIIIGTIMIKKAIKWLIGAEIGKSLAQSLAKSASMHIGTQLAKALQMDLLGNASIGTVFKTLGSQVGGVFVAAFKAIGGDGAALSVMQAFAPVATLIAGIGSIVVGVGLAVWNFVSMWQDGFNIIKELIMVVGTMLVGLGVLILTGNPISLVVAAVVAAVATIVILVHDNWDAIVTFFSAGIEKIKSFFGGIATKVSEVWTNIKQAASTALQPIIDMAGKIKQTVSTAFDAIKEKLHGTFVAPIEGVMEQFEAPIKEKLESIQAKWTELKDVISERVEDVKTILSALGTAFQALYNIFIKPYVDMAKTLITTVVNGLRTFITNDLADAKARFDGFKQGVIIIVNTLLNGIKNAINNFISIAKAIFTVARDFILLELNTVADIISAIVEGVATHIGIVIDTILGVIEGLITFLVDVFKGDWEAAWTDIKDIVATIFDGIHDYIKDTVNTIIGVINAMIKGIVTGVNAAINALNGLHIDVPDWVTDLTGVTAFGFNIPTLPIPQIPKLAKGAVIPPNKEFMAILGDQKNGTNIEAPLDTIIEAMRVALQSDGYGVSSNQPIELKIDGQTLARLTMPYNVKEMKRKGYNVSVLTN